MKSKIIPPDEHLGQQSWQTSPVDVRNETGTVKGE